MFNHGFVPGSGRRRVQATFLAKNGVLSRRGMLLFPKQAVVIQPVVLSENAQMVQKAT